MKRKNILRVIALLALCSLSVYTFDSCTRTPRKYIGLQLYSIRDSIMRDVPGAIAKVEKMGYKFVEPAGYADGMFYGIAPDEFRTLCETHRLPVISSHAGKDLSDSASWDKMMSWWDDCIAAHKAVGAMYIVQPFMGAGAYRNLDTLKLYCDYFNLLGEKCAEQGIRFGYHNHDKELSTKLDGQTIYDFMLQNTDPSKVTFEIDLYWTVVGGANPVDYFNKYPGRFELWHIKDKAEIGASGMMDFKAIWAGAKESGLKYGIVEVEEYNYDEYTSCKKSLDFLNKAPYVVMPE